MKCINPKVRSSMGPRGMDKMVVGPDGDRRKKTSLTGWVGGIRVKHRRFEIMLSVFDAVFLNEQTDMNLLMWMF